MAARDFDIVLFGATGFTGKLVAEALLPRTGGRGWALAGRSEEKLRAVQRELAARDPRAAELPLLIADVENPSSLAEVARRATVVCTTVGPYARYGIPVVRACAEAGTHYCDLTGEVQFMRSSIDGWDTVAKGSGARIVHGCGFDSIPSDLGVLSLHEHFRRAGRRLARAKFVLGASKGGFSGGTVASMLTTFEQLAEEPGLRKLLGDPYALVPDRRADRGPDRGDQQGVAHDDDIDLWTGPFIMASVNTRVVRRSNALLGWPYGRDFRYSEVTGTGGGLRGLLRASALTAGYGGFGLSILNPVTRPLVQRLLPKPGEGPSRELCERGYFKARIYGTAEGEPRPSAVCRVEGDGDPGYGATSRMLAEAALYLADTATEGRPGGVLTPASALGLPFAERLGAAGVRFRVEEYRAEARRAEAEVRP